MQALNLPLIKFTIWLSMKLFYFYSIFLFILLGLRNIFKVVIDFFIMFSSQYIELKVNIILFELN